MRVFKDRQENIYIEIGEELFFRIKDGSCFVTIPDMKFVAYEDNARLNNILRIVSFNGDMVDLNTEVLQ